MSPRTARSPSSAPATPVGRRRSVGAVAIGVAAGSVVLGLLPAAAAAPAGTSAGPDHHQRQVKADRARQARAPRLTGFTAAHSARERAAERTYLRIPNADVASRLDRFLARKPGLLGTTGDRRRVHYVVKKLRSYGLHPKVETVYPYLSIPRSISVTQTAPTHRRLPTKERCRAVETACRAVVQGYNALSPSGNVRGQIVYVNYGTVADYRVLHRRGISVKGKIVLARYGAVFRGVKTQLAAEHGAKAAILYSDPEDDGFRNGKTYPHGPWRAPDGIQRGSIQQLWKYGGDPLTPGWKATRHAHRIDPSKANLGRIPTTPISYGAAKPLLKALHGQRAPKGWQGGLPLTYRIGPGPTRVHLDLDIGYRIKPIWNVTATIRGSHHPHQIVYVGAHRDTWTYGSDDNLSGTETVMQVGRGLGRLLRQGWRPDRTIRLATWDGEEYGLFGSTEHAEGQGRKRLDHVVTYVNLDGAAGEDFGATGVPSLDRVVFDTTKQIHWPHTNGSIYDDWAKKSGGDPTVARLGSGSDYTAFFDHFGVPSVDIGAGTGSGDYHCSCDNFTMERRYIDPGWRYHVAMAKEIGVVAMRLAESDAVLLRYPTYAGSVRRYLARFDKHQVRAYGRHVVRVAPLIAQTRRWERVAERVQKRQGHLLATGHAGPALQKIDHALMRTERQLLARPGLPGRHWFKHQIYAPGVNAGYGTQVLPALNDALFLRHKPAEAKRYGRLLQHSLRGATHTLYASL